VLLPFTSDDVTCHINVINCHIYFVICHTVCYILQAKRLDTALTKFLEKGVWFIALFNDQDKAQTVGFGSEFFSKFKHCIHKFTATNLAL